MRVTAKAGATFADSAAHVPGTPANPLSDEELAAKFRDCVRFGLRPLGEGDAARLAAALGRIGELRRLGEAFAGLHG